ncbi:Golgi membrane exchange factor (Ric1p-Rgp1p) subunit [Coniosporium apollinis]|uniref:Golgi membrane exchange factor (Ric1p-Rgp1p) subunit n=1 Tax=Coniosporium apollinis TaxID=61459 RepID=A0ABQ9NR52_9PEZI|nr:Golgi membrane exchange factor (Ric1p-Rgp1p) subunit [Coniosporium apollinis]
MSTNIRVFIKFKESTVFAGEDIECTVTFKNIAPVPGTEGSPTRGAKPNGFIPGGERQRKTAPLQPHARPAPSRAPSVTSQATTQYTRGHRPALSLNTPPGFTSGHPLGPPSGGTSGPTASGQKHGRSLSIEPSDALPRSFKFPPSPEASAHEPSATAADHKMKAPDRGSYSPRPPDKPPDRTQNLSPLARILSGSSMNGTPRSSGEFYTASNHSDGTLASEYIPQPTARLLARPAHLRQASQARGSISQRPPEVLMMGYAQVMGSFTLDGSLVNQAPFEEIKRKGVFGGQGGGGVVGVERPKRESGLFGALGWGGIGESLNGLIGGSEPSSIREMRSKATSKSIPLLSTPQSILFVDLQLAPGESRSYSYSFTLPRGLPPTHRGRAMKVSYHLAIGTQRPGSARDQQVRHVDVPFRVLGSVTDRGEILGHDLMSPYILLRDEARTSSLDPPTPSNTSTATSTAKNSKDAAAGLQDFQNYITALLTAPSPTSGLLSPTTPTPLRRRSTLADLNDPAPRTAKESIDLAILRSNISPPGAPSPSRFSIARSGRLVGVLHLARPSYRLGESIDVVINFSDADIPTYAVAISLENCERVDPALALRSEGSIERATRKVLAAQTENTLWARRVAVSLAVPSGATPEFVTSGVALVWRVRVEFVTPRVGDEGAQGREWGELLEEVGRDERGVMLAAVERLACESFEVAIPVRVYGAVVGGGESGEPEGLVV